ncbi:MAG: glycoside hydrolase/phage tail family protein [Hyphomicrobiaceae bacterium]
MATLALTVAGAAVGGALLPSGVTILGATLSGALIGSQVGALAGSYVDQVLFGTSGQSRSVTGPRLTDLKVTTSTEGAPIPRLFGRARLGGQVIWASEIEEVAVTTSAGGASKGGSSGGGTTQTEYRYFANFAVGLCEGTITGLQRVWANGEELDLSLYDYRVHRGEEDQQPDSLIAAHEGSDNAPAYRGLAYIVFERMALAKFGNRLPQLSFEVQRSVDSLENAIRGVVMIPGSGEFAYAPSPVNRRTGTTATTAENTNTLIGGTDWEVAVDQLDETLPNARSTSLVVSWFGTDLRAGHCQIRPAVDRAQKITNPLQWSVAGLTRATAAVVSTRDGKPAYGGTPSDQTVVAAIQDLKARGHKVLLTPFILMDIAEANALPDPYTGGTSQPAYPWRGRITVDPAPGRPGSPDKTSNAIGQISAVVGAAQPADFTIVGNSVVYSGPSEWSLRRMVLHYAKLAVAAGGVDAIVIGTELRGLSQVRSATSSYPFVAALVALAADVKAIVGPGTKVTYAADWSEYFGHHAGDGSGDVHFHLDPLWASADIDAVAIDCYWPLSDWRDRADHLDAQAGVRSPYDLAYLKANLFAGEGYDWYYASVADRDAQVRTPITDSAAGKPWVFRFKDVRSWWSNPHHDRPGGTEQTSPTAWVAQSKPIWFTEIGCPAIDKGANQPNVFFDPKSSESALPYYSRGDRDDLIQRRYLQAFVEAFDPAHTGYVAGANPQSVVYGGAMLDLTHVHVYAWDARPYPAFPSNTDVWGDGENWQLGHWLNGRIAGQPLDVVAARLLESYGFLAHDTSGVDGIVTGLVIERPMSAREALSPLELAYFLDTVESEDMIRLQHRGAGGPVAQLLADDMVEDKPGAPLLTMTRAQETDLPASARIAFSVAEADYRQGVATSRRLTGASGRIADAQLPLVMEQAQAGRVADTWLFESWASRERARFAVPPSAMALEPGDVVSISRAGRTHLLRITGIGDHGARDIEAQAIDPEIYGLAPGINRDVKPTVASGIGPVLGLFLDLPMLSGNEDPLAGYVAAARSPWPGGAAFYRSPEDSGFQLVANVTRGAVTGVLLEPLAAGAEGRLDHANHMRVRLDQGLLSSTTPLALYAGANGAAIETSEGFWEVVQFETATLVAPQTYELGRLLRAQAGTDDAALSLVPAGARFVLLDQSITPVVQAHADIGLAFNWRYGPSSRDIGDVSYESATHTFRGRGLMPLSPVHVRASRSGGDVIIHWIRRTRTGGDNWSTPEVPLGEDVEAYEVDILSGSTVVRTLSATTPTVTYTAADQTSDFGAPQPSITIRIAQMSAQIGRGVARLATV